MEEGSILEKIKKNYSFLTEEFQELEAYFELSSLKENGRITPSQERELDYLIARNERVQAVEAARIKNENHELSDDNYAKVYDTHMNAFWEQVAQYNRGEKVKKLEHEKEERKLNDLDWDKYGLGSFGGVSRDTASIDLNTPEKPNDQTPPEDTSGDNSGEGQMDEEKTPDIESEIIADEIPEDTEDSSLSSEVEEYPEIPEDTDDSYTPPEEDAPEMPEDTDDSYTPPEEDAPEIPEDTDDSYTPPEEDAPEIPEDTDDSYTPPEEDAPEIPEDTEDETLPKDEEEVPDIPDEVFDDDELIDEASMESEKLDTPEEKPEDATTGDETSDSEAPEETKETPEESPKEESDADSSEEEKEDELTEDDGSIDVTDSPSLEEEKKDDEVKPEETVEEEKSTSDKEESEEEKDEKRKPRTEEEKDKIEEAITDYEPKKAPEKPSEPVPEATPKKENKAITPSAELDFIYNVYKNGGAPKDPESPEKPELSDGPKPDHDGDAIEEPVKESEPEVKDEPVKDSEPETKDDPAVVDRPKIRLMDSDFSDPEKEAEEKANRAAFIAHHYDDIGAMEFSKDNIEDINLLTYLNALELLGPGYEDAIAKREESISEPEPAKESKPEQKDTPRDVIVSGEEEKYKKAVNKYNELGRKEKLSEEESKEFENLDGYLSVIKEREAEHSKDPDKILKELAEKSKDTPDEITAMDGLTKRVYEQEKEYRAGTKERKRNSTESSIIMKTMKKYSELLNIYGLTDDRKLDEDDEFIEEEDKLFFAKVKEYESSCIDRYNMLYNKGEELTEQEQRDMDRCKESIYMIGLVEAYYLPNLEEIIEEGKENRDLLTPVREITLDAYIKANEDIKIKTEEAQRRALAKAAEQRKKDIIYEKAWRASLKEEEAKKDEKKPEEPAIDVATEETKPEEVPVIEVVPEEVKPKEESETIVVTPSETAESEELTDSDRIKAEREALLSVRKLATSITPPMDKKEEEKKLEEEEVIDESMDMEEFHSRGL